MLLFFLVISCTKNMQEEESREQLELLIQELEKQLEIELKIKSGAEQLYRHYSLNKKHKNKKTSEQSLGNNVTKTKINKKRLLCLL
jgi:hypothetical protein